jgi:predicted NBD/HSP70 family sugar kinase
VTRRENIEATVSDLVVRFLYYYRKDDESLPVGAIDDAIRKGEISADEIVQRFASELRRGIPFLRVLR